MPRLRPEDLLRSTHRGHGHTLAKGADPDAMMKELAGREGGCCGGMGGSMHIAGPGVGMLGANGMAAADIAIAAGAACSAGTSGSWRSSGRAGCRMLRSRRPPSWAPPRAP